MKKFVFIITVMLSIASTSAQDFKNVWVYSSAPETIGSYSPDYIPAGEGLTVEINIGSVNMFGTTYLIQKTTKDGFGKKFTYNLINENDSDKVFKLTMIRTDYNRYYLNFSKDNNNIGFDAWKTTSAKNIKTKYCSKSTYIKSTKSWSDWSKPEKYKSLVTLYKSEILFSNKQHDEYRMTSIQYFNNKAYATGVDNGVKWRESRHSGFDNLGTRIEILMREYDNEEYEFTIIYNRERKIKYKTF